MKAIVFSDSHDRVSLMEDLTKKYLSRIDCIIHLGDCTEDTAALRELGKPLFQVRGNNDYDSLYPLERTVSLAGKRIYMTHGHRQKVYWNTDVLYYTAAQYQDQDELARGFGAALALLALSSLLLLLARCLRRRR